MNCKVYGNSSDVCIECRDGHIQIVSSQNDGKALYGCILADDPVPHCQVYGNATSKCAQCDKGYYLDPDSTNERDFCILIGNYCA